jgi:hypothetical protein
MIIDDIMHHGSAPTLKRLWETPQITSLEAHATAGNPATGYTELAAPYQADHSDGTPAS